MKRRVLCGLLAVVMLLSLLTGLHFSANAASSQQKKRAIGIVLDNSGSMYMTALDPMAWCRAAYAMEVFASMMNQGDIMRIYPMNSIEVGGDTYTSYRPLQINGPNEASVIRTINTPMAGGTPVEPIDDAYNDLKTVSADEKWLIVLSDGKGFHVGSDIYEKDADESRRELNKRLDPYSKDMQVMYLGIGTQAITPTESNPERQSYKKVDSSEGVLNALTDMCNRIFGRDALPNAGTQFSFDVSMKKLIVFAQGENISDVTLNGTAPETERQVRYSEQGTTDSDYLYQQQPDKKLQGVIATYSNLGRGDYSLSYTGKADPVSVYYEPDVELVVHFLDGQGNEVDPSAALYPGDYTIEYELLDAVTGENVDSSSLMGGIEYGVSYQINGQTYTHESATAGSLPVHLEADDTFDAQIRVDYLSNYHIEINGQDMGWPAGGLKVTNPVKDLQLVISGGAAKYPLTKLEEQARY